MNAKKRYVCSLAAHAALLVMECLAFRSNPFTEDLKFYTELSNLLGLLVSAAYLLEAVPRLKKGCTAPSPLMRALSYTATCMLTLTFLVVVFILSGTMEEGMTLADILFKGHLLYMHFLCPLVSLFGFLLFEKEPALGKKDLLIALSPTLLYAAVTITLNLLRVMHGPYPFLYVYEQPVYMSCVWFLLVVGGAFLIAWVLKKLSGGKKSAAKEK